MNKLSLFGRKKSPVDTLIAKCSLHSMIQKQKQRSCKTEKILIFPLLMHVINLFFFLAQVDGHRDRQTDSQTHMHMHLHTHICTHTKETARNVKLEMVTQSQNIFVRYKGNSNSLNSKSQYNYPEMSSSWRIEGFLVVS